MPEPAPVVWIDTTYDREYASNGISRYQAYLHGHQHRLLDDGEPTSDPLWFALGCWCIATPSVMVPGLVGRHQRVTSLTVRRDVDEPFLVATVTMVSQLPDRIGQGLGWHYAGWERDVRDTWIEPAWRAGHPVVLPLLTVRTFVPAGELPAPRYLDGAPGRAAATAAVEAIGDRINADVGPVLTALDASGGSR